MTDADSQDRELLVDGFVDDSVAPHSKPPKTAELALESRPSRRLVSQPVDRFNQAGPLLNIDRPERLGGATLDLDRVAHA